jgi:hypothetical protein
MKSDKITKEQKKLLLDLYEHVEVYGLSPGTFRDKYDIGIVSKKWANEDTLTLQNSGLISLNESLLMASIVSPNLTESGRTYVNKLELNF